jgi:hypothetical protein
MIQAFMTTAAFLAISLATAMTVGQAMKISNSEGEEE